ncbi:MAG: T9SS type A sorting domain-containing protein, partial [Chitinophagaceae bacterium]
YTQSDTNIATPGAYQEVGGFDAFIASFSGGGKLTTTSIAEPFIHSDASMLLEVYPNPVMDRLQVKLRQTGSKEAMVSISDMSGRMIQSLPLAGKQQAALDVKALAAGTYLLRYEDGQRQETITFIKR